MEKLFNLQMFAVEKPNVEATVTAKGYMDDAEAHEFYDRTLKKSVYEEYTLHNYTDVIKLPKNNGKTMVLRKMGKYVTNGAPLVEGQLPKEDEPMAIYEYRVGLNDHGGYITYSDQVDIYSLNSWSTRLQENQGYAVGELLQSKVRDIMYSSTNRWIAGATAFDTLQAARDTATTLNINDLAKIRAFLKRAKVKPMADGNYLFLISPEVEATVLDLTRDQKQFTFVELANAHQKGGQIYSGNSLGTFMGFHFISLDALGEISGATGASATSAGQAIHGCLILGRYNGEKGAKIVKLEGYGEPKTIIKPLGSAGTNDPLDQKGSIGWKMMGWGGTVLYPEAVLVYECLAEKPATEFDETKREHFIGGYTGKVVDGEADKIKDEDKDSYINANKKTA